MHRQFHARKQQLNLFLAAVAVLVTLAFMATLSNNGTLMEKQALQGRALDTFAVGGGEPVRWAELALHIQAPARFSPRADSAAPSRLCRPSQTASCTS